MRYINADKLIFKLNGSQVEFDEFYKGLGLAKQITDDMPTEDVRPVKWIPVSEKLPEYNEDVIITHKDFKGQPTTDVAYFNEFSEFKLFWDEGEHLDVIAWMPLPAPCDPKESDDKA